MGAEDLGPWDPITVTDAVSLLGDAPFCWWLTGGHALEAHLGQSWRTHDDLDIGIMRSDAQSLVEKLTGWDIHIAAAGELYTWDGRRLDAERSENNVWCRPSPTAPWAIDVTIGEGDEHDWIFRRDHAVRRPWDTAVLTTADGVPYLAPEIQLLFKSTGLRAKDNEDAATVLPLLEPARRAWLAAHLPVEHRWHQHL